MFHFHSHLPRRVPFFGASVVVCRHLGSGPAIEHLDLAFQIGWLASSSGEDAAKASPLIRPAQDLPLPLRFPEFIIYVMNGWMNGWFDGWMVGMGGWVVGWMDEGLDG